MGDFDWDEANIAHIRRHGVEPHEAEEALEMASIDGNTYVIDDEMRFENIGHTRTGRILTVVSVDRKDKVRVVTAFDATQTDKRVYLRRMVQ